MASEGKLFLMEGDLQAFAQHLEGFGDLRLRRLSEHFRPDMAYVIENNFASALSELTGRRVIAPQQAQDYEQLEKQQDATKAAEKLVQNVFDKGKEAVMGLWKYLFGLRSRSSHPNLHGMVDEMLHNGEPLFEEILLNERGHPLDPDMKACQEAHKSILFEQTKSLTESGKGAQPEGQSFSIVNRYVELKVVSDAYFKKWKDFEHEALAAAGELNEYRLRKKTQVELERITPDRLFRWCYRSRRTPCSVMVSGVAGVGKTTLMQKFVFDWARGRHYQKFAFVFFFKFRDLNALTKTSFEWLIHQTYPDLQDHLETILEIPERLLFIFDGLDESKSDVNLSKSQTPELCMRPRDVKPVGVIVASLLNQTLLKGCSVLLTSRPSKLIHLDTGVLHRVVSIVGFLVEEREIYFLNFFGQSEVAQRALRHVRDSQVLYTLCYNPSYCWITCTALRPCFASRTGQPPPLPKTVTQLFVSYVKHMMTSRAREPLKLMEVRESLMKLGWLADYGLNNRMLVFEENYLEFFGVEKGSFLTAFLVESLRDGHSPSQVTYSFIHLTVQEFFAALVHYLDFVVENFEESVLKVKGSQSGEYEIFFRFLCGLSHPATRAPLEEILGKFSAEATRRVIDQLTETDCSALLSLENDFGKRKTLNFFSLLFEAHNSQLVRRVLGDAARMDFSELYLLPVDCAVLAYVLKCCNKVERLSLDSCLIQNDGLQRLGPELHKVRELSLHNNDLRDPAVKDLASALKHPACRLETLRLSKNVLTEQCCRDLSLALSGNQSLLSLDLTKNKLRDGGLSDLLQAFSSPQCKIQHLVIQENALTDASCGRLCSALANNQSLRQLNLSGNPFTDRCEKEMHDLILKCPALTEIRLNLTDMSPAAEGRLKGLESARGGLRICV